MNFLSGHPVSQYSLTCRQTSSSSCFSRISHRRFSVAGKLLTTKLMYAEISSSRSFSPADTGARIRSLCRECEILRNQITLVSFGISGLSVGALLAVLNQVEVRVVCGQCRYGISTPQHSLQISHKPTSRLAPPSRFGHILSLLRS